MKNYKKIFELYAESSTQTVKKSDLPQMLASAGHSTIDLSSIEQDISYERFLEIAKQASISDITFEQLKKAFESFDMQKTGLIHFKSIVGLIADTGDLDEEELDEYMQMLSPDKDGYVNYLALMKNWFELKE